MKSLQGKGRLRSLFFASMCFAITGPTLLYSLLASASLLQPAFAQLYSDARSNVLNTGTIYATGHGWEKAFQRASAFVTKLNLTEKAQMVTGFVGGPCVGGIAPIPRLGFKGLCLQDGPLAIRYKMLLRTPYYLILTFS